MGKPAARLGDMTAHGGSIVGPGMPTVLIGGMPAVRVGDMHVCPMLTPGVPPIPHVGGPILPPGGIGVLIGGMPAARMGDMAMCVGPPSTIILGCPTVLIGEVGSGSGGAGGGGGAGAGGGSAAAGAVTSSSIAGTPETEEISSHYIDLQFVDKANLPVGGMRYTLTYPDNSKAYGFLGKQIKRTGVPEGNYTVELEAIVDVKWSVKKVPAETDVDILVETIGVKNGTAALITIMRCDLNAAEKMVACIDCSVDNDSIQRTWRFEYDEGEAAATIGSGIKKRRSLTQFYFTVSIGSLTERSGFLQISDELKISLKNEFGKPVADEPYRVYLPSGEIRNGTLGSDGTAVERNVPAGKARVVFPDCGGATGIPS